MNVTYDDVFASDFHVEEATHMDSATYELGAPSSGIGRTGTAIRVIHPGGSWTARFHSGDGRVMGVYATPSPNHVCVVDHGRGYWIPVRAPDEYEAVRVYPITIVRAIPELHLLLFADFTRLSGYNRTGFAWLSERLSADGIELDSFTGEVISGRGWNAARNRKEVFRVDPRSGATVPWSPPPG